MNWLQAIGFFLAGVIATIIVEVVIYFWIVDHLSPIKTLAARVSKTFTNTKE